MAEKATVGTRETFAGVFPHDARAVSTKWFGAPCGTVNDNMFAGVFEQGIALRLGEDRVQELAGAHEGLVPFSPMGRRWQGYAHADAATWRGTDELKGWVLEALEYTATLPPKEKKPKKAKKV
ncbi:MAG: TfoX/Sxy family protein [Alphaproteobacteria bacterium]|nr:TfoX/Sxy family protein [Alphaproteobacteria bacterium]MCB9696611.1 TfoX/Sxy family protein [Alphaproteobacteria bacterium]